MCSSSSNSNSTQIDKSKRFIDIYKSIVVDKGKIKELYDLFIRAQEEVQGVVGYKWEGIRELDLR